MPRDVVKQKAYIKRWRSENKAKIREYDRKYSANRRATNPSYKLAYLLRCRLNKVLRRDQKVGSSVKDLGCSIDELKLHLESQFQPGMTWSNQGEWHLDHIKPLAKFDLTDRDQFLKANHFSNLQPLWADENRLKGAK